MSSSWPMPQVGRTGGEQVSLGSRDDLAYRGGHGERVTVLVDKLQHQMVAAVQLLLRERDQRDDRVGCDARPTQPPPGSEHVQLAVGRDLGRVAEQKGNLHDRTALRTV